MWYIDKKIKSVLNLPENHHNLITNGLRNHLGSGWVILLTVFTFGLILFSESHKDVPTPIFLNYLTHAQTQESKGINVKGLL